VTVTAPLMLPVALGVNVTLNVHVAPAATLAPQGSAPPGTAEKSPLAARVLRVSATFSLFVRVIVCAALVVVTGCAEKVRLVGDMITGRTAVPETLKTC